MKDILSEEEEVKPKRGTKRKAYDEEEDASLIGDEFSDDEDFDTVSKVLRPSGVQKEKVQYENEYDEACSKLQLNSIPKELPCREKEIKKITHYLSSGLMHKGSSSSLYISGMPGTGKTATTLEVIRNILESRKAG
jgi:predicted ATP-dependent serine protease